MNEVYRSGVQGKLYRLPYVLNKNTKFRVKTPVGLTEEKDRGEGLGQGTLEGALISALNLDAGVNYCFEKSKNEVNYGNVRMQPLLYQDDILRLSYSIADAQTSNDKMESLAETKLLDYNLEKSCFLLIGSNKAKKHLAQQNKRRPLTLCGAPMVQEECAKYLGDWISSAGLGDSVAVTVKKRKGLALMAIHDIRRIIDDCRSMVCGGLATGLEFGTMLFNAECWFELPNSTLKELEDIQLRFYRSLLAVGTGCPTPMLYWETGGLLMKFRILKKKLLFIHHVATLPKNTLAKEIFDTQKRFNLPGLVQDCEAFLIHAGVTDLEDYTSTQWKKFVKHQIAKLNQDEIVNNMGKYKKVEKAEYVDRHHKVQDYLTSMNVTDARLRFKIESGMTPTVRMNFMNDKDFSRQQWVCSGCSP